jgi:excisionase family DNA binding protein
MNENGKAKMQVLTIIEAAELLQISPQTVQRMIHKKELPGAFKVGGQWRLNESKLAQWLADGCPQLKDGAIACL